MPRRRKPIPKRSKGYALRQAHVFGPQATLCRELPCLVCGSPYTVPAHVKSRGAGGTDSDCVPLCDTKRRWAHGVSGEGCHDAQHRIGIKTFQARFGVDLEVEAAKLADRARGSQ